MTLFTSISNKELKNKKVNPKAKVSIVTMSVFKFDKTKEMSIKLGRITRPGLAIRKNSIFGHYSGYWLNYWHTCAK